MLKYYDMWTHKKTGRALLYCAAFAVLVGFFLSGFAGSGFFRSDLGFSPSPNNQGPSGPDGPPLTRVNSNLVSDPGITNTSFWTLTHGSTFDASVSRGTGGSIRLTNSGSAIASNFLPVEEGKAYTMSAFMKTDTWPTYTYLMIGVYHYDPATQSYNFLYNAFIYRQGTTTSRYWQEIAGFFTPKEGETHIQLKYYRVASPVDDATVWLDDFYMGEGLSLEQPASAKNTFDGSDTRVDAQGHFSVRKGTHWEPFFPFCIYNASSADKLSTYSAQGFNCTAWTWPDYAISTLPAAKNAVSTFNPDGMRIMIDLTGYLAKSTSASYGNLSQLSSFLTATLASPLSDHVLGYYWDNEQYTEYDMLKQVTDLVKSIDTDSTGKRHYPISMLAGQTGLARTYHNLTDMVEMYLRDAAETWQADTLWMNTEEQATVLRHIEGQTSPLGIGVISEEGNAAEVRRLVYEHLITGGTGIAYYRDGACYYFANGNKDAVGCTDISARPVWNEIPLLRQEIDQMLPLLRQPYWTDWSATPSSTDVMIGTRNYASEGYVFLINTLPHAQTVSLTFQDLPYQPQALYDYFTGNLIAPVSTGTVTITLQANQTAVYRLARSIDDCSSQNQQPPVLIGKKGQVPVRQATLQGCMHFDQNTLYLLHTPDTQTTRSFDLSLRKADGSPAAFYLYEYSAPDTTEEILHAKDQDFRHQFPGKFAASPAATNDTALSDTLQDLSAANGVSWLAADDSADAVNLHPHTFYVLVVKNADGATANLH